MVGGEQGGLPLTDVWEWDGTDWQQNVLAGGGPSGGYLASLAFDTVSGLITQFGGSTQPNRSASTDETWTLIPDSTGFAIWSPYGDGCGRGSGSSFYEVFDNGANPIDMVGSGFTMFLGGTNYTVVPPVSAFVAPTTPDLGLGDDAILNVVLPVTGNWIAGFPHATGVATSIGVDSNGSVFLVV